jgi:acyl-CoA thioester hydrolase
VSSAGISFAFGVRVYYEDTDAGGVVYFANYLRFMERARTEWLRQLGFDQSELREHQGILFVVRGVEATYHRPARLDDALTVQSRLSSLSRVALRFEQSVERDGEVLVNGSSDVICVGATSLRPCRMPDSLMRVLQSVAGGTI